MGRNYGTIFSPLGYEPQAVIDQFPDRIGLDVIFCEQNNLSELVLGAESLPNGKVPVALARYPHILKQAESRLAPGLITEMIPLWWNPNDVETKEQYYRSLSHVASTRSIDPFLLGCSQASQARQILYADRSVNRALHERWELIKQGIFMENLFKRTFNAK